MQRTYHIHHVPGQHITFEMRLTIETVYNRNPSFFRYRTATVFATF